MRRSVLPRRHVPVSNAIAISIAADATPPRAARRPAGRRARADARPAPRAYATPTPRRLSLAAAGRRLESHRRCRRPVRVLCIAADATPPHAARRPADRRARADARPAPRAAAAPAPGRLSLAAAGLVSSRIDGAAAPSVYSTSAPTPRRSARLDDQPVAERMQTRAQAYATPTPRRLWLAAARPGDMSSCMSASRAVRGALGRRECFCLARPRNRS